MALAPYSWGLGSGPPCAVKIGPLSCFCLWEGQQAPGTPVGVATEVAEEEKFTWTAEEDPDDASSVCNERPRDELALLDSNDGRDGSIQEGTGAASSGAFAGGEASGALAGARAEHPLLVAARLFVGSAPTVERELRQLTTAGSAHFHEPDISRLRRLLAQHRCAANSATWADYEHNTDFGIEHGSRSDPSGTNLWFRTVELRGCSLVKGLAALLEVDLARAYCDESEASMVDPLGVHTAKRDAVWRVTSKSRRKEKVWTYSVVDALEDACGALVVVSHTPLEPRSGGLSEGLSTFAEARDAEGSDECVIHCVEPIWPELAGGAAASSEAEPEAVPESARSKRGIAPIGFRLTQLGASSGPPETSGPRVPGLKAADGDLSDQRFFQSRLQAYLISGKQLEQRMRTSPRTDLYERFARRLNLPGPAAIAKASLLDIPVAENLDRDMEV